MKGENISSWSTATSKSGVLIRQKMEHFKLPPAVTGNASENWRKWEQRFVYMTAAELYSLGEEALEIYNTFDIAKEAPEDGCRYNFGSFQKLLYT